MVLLAALLACGPLALAAAPKSDAGARGALEPPPAVILLPLHPDATVSTRQARGIGAQIRGAVEQGGFARMLSESKDDEKQAERCQREVKCLAALADVRGADRLLAGLVSPAPDGLRVSVVVVGPDPAHVRRVEVTLQGNAEDARRIDRLARSALNPSALRGAILVTGADGASVEIDGVAQGTLPLAAPIDDLIEGEHVVVVRKEGLAELRRTVSVVHGDISELKAILLEEQPVSRAPARPGERDRGVPTDALVAGSIGGGLVLLGGVAGTLALLDSLDAERRAEAQQLTFPADSGLLLRGQVYAWTANGLYLAGAGALGTGIALWLLADDDGAEARP
jgi:hypothetical protein